MSVNTYITEYRVVRISFLVSLIDVVMNCVVAIVTGSVVMLSGSFQGFADLTAAGFLMVGYMRANRRADKLHPFGHGKELYFWTLISAIVMMTITATASFYTGLQRVLHPQDISYIGLGFVVLVIAFVTNGYAASLSIRKLLQKRSIRYLSHEFFHSNSVSTKNTLVLDAMGTSASIIGIISLLLSLMMGETRFDGIGAMVIGISTAVLAFLLVMGVRGFLVGKRASREDEEKIKRAVLTVPEVNDVLDLRTMQIGSERLLVNLEVHMKNNLVTDELERLTDVIKERVKEQVPTVQHIQVELEGPTKK